MRHERLDELLRLKSTGEITPEQRVELEDLIRTDEEACRQYLDYTSCLLYTSPSPRDS